MMLKTLILSMVFVLMFYDVKGDSRYQFSPVPLHIASLQQKGNHRQVQDSFEFVIPVTAS